MNAAPSSMMNMFTREMVIKAKTDPEIAAAIAAQAKMMVISMYMLNAQQMIDEDEDEPEAVICDHCGELTLYSSQSLLPASAGFPVMCLSDKCI